ncbi:MAG: NADH-quinone oxidoreductase subunit M [Bacteroidetes bacterium]|nr:NADH-quinone oxidoreductase subunit M [Bacteroidota bacterium]
MIALLLILIPFLSGLAAFFMKDGKMARNWSLFSSLLTLLSIIALLTNSVPASNESFDIAWLPFLGSSFSLAMNGLVKMLVLLNAIIYFIVFLATFRRTFDQPNRYFGLMLLMQAGMMGVFLAADGLVFYFFWELALVPAYFLCSQWGNEKKIQATFKFFVYTFLGSLLMLIGMIIMHAKTPDHSYALQSFMHAKLSATEENLLFWLFFIAFAIKMPLFPFHTWQPFAYEQTDTSITIILSSVMVKMGLFAVLRWLLPVFPHASISNSHIIIILGVISLLYASVIAVRQNDLKRLIAYSSIAHIGLMCAAIFSGTVPGMQGVMIQMFNHGIIVAGLWITAEVIETQYGTRKISELGGLAQKAPVLAILLLVMALGNIALPLTSAFVGEFLMFSGLFQYNLIICAVALVSIILSAIYTLNMVQNIFYGNTLPATQDATDINRNARTAMILLAICILFLGFYPQPLIELLNSSVQSVLSGLNLVLK